MSVENCSSYTVLNLDGSLCKLAKDHRQMSAAHSGTRTDESDC